jgi:predicted  nucleic acid-binding Zn-ribbon protein
MEKTSGGGHPSCIDEEKALAQAKRQLEEAQQKAENTKRWVRRLEELVFQHKGPLQSLSYALDNDVVNMLATLDRMVEALNKYIALAAPTAMDPESTASEASSMTRPVAELPAEVTQDVQQQEDIETQAQVEQAPNLPENGNATQQEHQP